MSYDSKQDTLNHIRRVDYHVTKMMRNLEQRIRKHDLSKLTSPEKDVFDAVTPKLKELTYGSDEYKAQLAEMKVALDHHYAHNSHHPEHYENGIRGMSLLDVVEMLADWKAASERHADGDIYKSIEINAERFGYSDDLKQIFVNTAREMLW